MIADIETTVSAATVQPEPPVRKTVLIIEDDLVFRDLLGMHISRAGYKVLLAEDAVTGGRMLLASRPDLLLLDILLPYLGGLELLEMMRQDPNLARTPVVCVTSMHDEPTYMKATELGVAAFLTKPVRVEELLGALTRVMEAAHPSSTDQEHDHG
jgi:DNA-binding response OmpR family regulator